LQILRGIISECETLSTLAEIFDMINYVLSLSQISPKIASSVPIPNGSTTWTADEFSLIGASGHSSESDENIPASANNEYKLATVMSRRTMEGYVVIDQSDMYTHVFTPIEEEKGFDYKFIVAVLTEYIRSLNFHHLSVEPFLYELLINFLVRKQRFYQLHQLLQYHVVSDSVHVACQLLSLEGTYPPAYQLALDMLKRLQTHEQILEVLLTKQQLLAAIRFVKTHKTVKVSPARFLEVATQTGDSTLFYTVYKFFEQRRGLQGCSKYMKMYKDKFEKNV